MLHHWVPFSYPGLKVLCVGYSSPEGTSWFVLKNEHYWRVSEGLSAMKIVNKTVFGEPNQLYSMVLWDRVKRKRTLGFNQIYPCRWSICFSLWLTPTGVQGHSSGPRQLVTLLKRKTIIIQNILATKRLALWGRWWPMCTLGPPSFYSEMEKIYSQATNVTPLPQRC